ncbi:MAG: Ig-like domain-containing protein [Gemmatimonadota bacterium]
MRSSFRIAGLVALALIGITCTDAPTGLPKSLSPRYLTFSPSFSPEAAEIYRGLSAFGIEVSEVHVRLTAPDGTTRDTVIVFPAGVNELTIEIPVPASSTGQAFTAVLELRDASHTVLFSGSQTVTATVAGAPAPTNPPVVVVNYTGPGRSTTRVTVQPVDQSIPATATLPVTATGFDATNAAVPDLLVRWTTSDAALAAVTSTGNATASVVGQGRRGTATISAITPSGITGATSVTFVPAAARLVVVSGGGQTGVAGSTLPQPLVVEVQATDNLPVPGATVTFRAVTAGGAVATASAVADATGRASTTLTLGKTAGAWTYEAASGTVTPVTVNETATAAPPAAIAVVSGDGQADSVGRTLPQALVVRVTNAFGATISGVPVSWARTGSGSLSASSSTTGADGTTSVTYTLGSSVGNEEVRATTAGVSGSAVFTLRVTARSASAIAITSGGGQTGKAKTTLPNPLVARVVDGLGNPVSGASVSWSASGEQATFTPASSTTGADGQASTSVTLGSAAGQVTVTASTGPLTASTAFTIQAGAPARIEITDGDGQSAPVNSAVPVQPRVLVTDSERNPVVGQQVVFAVASGGGSVTGATPLTNAGGVASVGSWTLGGTGGTNTLTATVGSVSATFVATGTSTSPTKFVVVTGPPTTIIVGAPIPAIKVRLADASNNPVNTAGVVVSLTGVVNPVNNTEGTPGGPSADEDAAGLNGFTASGTTDATGVATLTPSVYQSYVGTATITISSASVTSLVFSSIPVVAGAPAQLVLGNYPSNGTLGAPFANPPQVLLADAGRNFVTGAGVNISVAIATGGGTLGGSTTVPTDAQGRATFTNLTISGTPGGRTLVFSATGLASTSTSTITMNAGTPATMTRNAGDAQTATAGTAVSIPPSVLVKDAGGNPVAGVSVTFGPASGNGSVTGGTATTNASGIATVGSWSLSTTAGSNTLPATAGALNTSFTATGTSGSASKLVILNAPPTTIKVGTPIAPVRVQLADGANNPVTQSGVNVTLTVAAAPPPAGDAQANSEFPTGEPQSMTVGTDANGVATFAIPPYMGPTGQVTVTITASGFASYLSPVITVTPGDPAGLAIVAQPPATGTVGTPLQPATRVVVVDVAQNRTPAGGVSVTASIGTGGGTLGGTTIVQTDPQGQAVFGDLTISGSAGGRTLVFSAPGLAGTTTNTIEIGAGAPSTMTSNAGDGQTATAGSAVSIPPSVLVKDGSGNPVQGVSVTFTPGVNSGAVTGGTVSTNASGIATVGSWTLGSTAGTNTLTATAGALSASFTATGTSGSASKLALVDVVPTTITVGAAIPSIRVQLADAANNPVAQAGVTVSLVGTVTPVAPPDATPGGPNGENDAAGITGTFTATAITNASGIATLAPSAYASYVGTATITISASGATSRVFPGIPVIAGSPAQLILANYAGTGVIGAPFSPAPQLLLADAGRNLVTGAGVNVSAVIATGGGTLGGSTTVPTDAQGRATFTSLTISGTTGARTLTFSAPGLTSVTTAPITMTAGAAAAITRNAGDGQSATAGSTVAIPPSVLVKDASGNPVPGVSVTFAPGPNSGSVVDGVASTDANGIAAVGSWRLSSTAGPNTLTATAGSLNTTFSATGTSGTASQLLVLAAPPATIKVGEPIPQVRVQLADGANNPVRQTGVTVTLTVPVASPPAGEAVASDAAASSGTQTLTATTDANGIATFTIQPYFGPVGQVIITISAPSVTSYLSPAITVIPGNPAGLIILTQPPTTGASGERLVPSTRIALVDASQNRVGAQLNVGVSIASGGGTLSGTTTVQSDAQGQAIFDNLTISGPAGPRTLVFLATGLQGVTTSEIVVSAGTPATMTRNAGDGQSAPAGSSVSIPPSVLVTDASGNPVPNVSVTFAPGANSGSVTGGVASTNASGIAAVGSWTLRDTPGANSLVATLGALTTSFTATATVGSASKLAGASTFPTAITVGVPFAQPFAVRIADALGNAVAQQGVTVTLTGTVLPSNSTNSFTAVTDASGLATFATPSYDGPVGTLKISFTAPGVTTLTIPDITVSTGAAKRFVLKTQPSSSVIAQQVFPQQPVVQLVDAGDNPVSTAGVNATASMVGGSGTLNGTLVVATNASGVATFTNLSIANAIGPRTLIFQGSGLESAVSAPVSVNVGPATNIVIGSVQNQSGSVNQPVATNPSVQVRDAFGNNVPNVDVTFTPKDGSRANGSSTPVVVTSNVTGTARLASWTLGPAVGTQSIEATASLSGSPIVFTATAGPGAPARYLFATLPPPSAGSGVTFSSVPAVQLVDAPGNPIAQAGVPVTVIILSGGGTLSGNTTVNTDANGIATFPGLSISGTAGSRTLEFSDGLRTPATAPITITAGAAAKLSIANTFAAPSQSGTPFSTQPIVQLLDAGNNAVSTPGIQITATIASGPASPVPTLSFATATTDGTGKAVFSGLTLTGATGTYVLSFGAPSLTPISSAGIPLSAGTAATMLLNAGEGQSATVGTAVPIPPSVKVTDASGNPVSGVEITFTAGLGSQARIGATSAATIRQTTNAAGIAPLDAWTLGNAAGPYILTATASVPNGSPFVFHATATAGSAAKIRAVSSWPVSVRVGAEISPNAFTVELTDAANNRVLQQGVSVTARLVVAPSNTTITNTVSTDANGQATFPLPPYVGPIGTATSVISADGLTSLTSPAIPVLAGVPKAITMVTQPSSTATSGAPFAVQPVVQIVDAGGNATTGDLSVDVSIASGSGELTGTRTVPTDANGRVTFTNLGITGPAGARTLQFVSAGLTSATSSSINVTSPVATKLAFTSTLPSSITVGAPIDPGSVSAQLRDEFNNPVREIGRTVTMLLTVLPSGETVTVEGVTLADGSFTAPLSPVAKRIGAPSGTVTISMGSSGLTSALSPSIPIQTGTASALATITQPSTTAKVGVAIEVQPRVQIVDAGGNPIRTAGLIVDAEVLPQGSLSGNVHVATDGEGVVAYSDLAINALVGSRNLQFNRPGLTSSGSTSITVTAGDASKFAIVTQPSATAASGVVFAQQPILQITDAAGNPVTKAGIELNTVIASGGGTLEGSRFPSPDGNGRVTFTDLRITGTPGPRTLRFSGGGLVDAISNSIDITPAPASKLVIATAPPATAQSGVALTTQPVIQVADASGAPVSSPGIVVTATTTGGESSVTGVATATTNANGVATFTNLGINGRGLIALQFAASGLTSVVSANIDVGAPPAVSIAVNIGATPSTSGAIGTNMAIPIIIDMANAQGQNLASMTFDVTWDPTQFDYVSRTNGSFGEGPSYTVNTANTSTGRLAVSVFDNDGFSTGSPTILTVTLLPKASKSGSVTTAITTAGSADGNSIALSKFVIRPLTVTTGTPAAASIVTTSGLYVARLPRQPVAEGVITFTVMTASNQPVGAGYSVQFSGQREDCNFPGGATTNASGVVTLAVTTDSMRIGCTITASTPSEFSTKAFVTTVPYAATHVWFGGTAETYYDWDRAQSWIRMSDMSSTAPSSPSDVPYIAAFYGNPWPRLAANKTVGGLYMSAGSQIDLNGKQLTVAGPIDMGGTEYEGESFRTAVRSGTLMPRGRLNGRSSESRSDYEGSGYVWNGTVIVQGTVDIRGIFDKLTVGAGSCGGASPQYAHLRDAFAYDLMTVVCGAIVENALAGRLVGNAGSFVKVAGSGNFYVEGDADLLGDSLVVLPYSTTEIDGQAQIRGRLEMYGGSYLDLYGATSFNGTGSLANGEIYAASHVTFGGAGSAGYQFTGGALYVGGNFTQLNGSGPIAFKSSGVHQVSMVGGEAQTMQFADPVNNTIASLYADNHAGVSLLSDLTLSGGEFPFLAVANGPFVVAAGKTLATTGALFFDTGGTLRADGTVRFGSCYTDDDPYPIFNGSGTVNGKAPAEVGCELRGGPSELRGRPIPTARNRAPSRLPIKK